LSIFYAFVLRPATSYPSKRNSFKNPARLPTARPFRFPKKTKPKRKMKAQAVIPINPRNTKHNDENIDPKSFVPICQAGLQMKFAGICNETHRKRIKYRCPIKADRDIREIFGNTRYLDVTNDARMSIDRTSSFFRFYYSLRITVEQYNSRLATMNIERTMHFNFKAVKNQMKLAHLTLSCVACAAADAGQIEKIRCYKTFASGVA